MTVRRMIARVMTLARLRPLAPRCTFRLSRFVDSTWSPEQRCLLHDGHNGPPPMAATKLTTQEVPKARQQQWRKS